MNAYYNFLFIGLPYAALAIFLFGTIYRYRVTKFKFSSLSSEFLEGKKLFWGSVPFHWGIIFLFFGHLIGFLFPQSVIAWNAVTVRLLIIELSAFAFGISTLIGLTVLIIRRRTNARIQIVTSKMDLLIEVLLLIEIFFGLWVAYEFRWGSSWFAAVMSPYLLSIFTFSPEITAMVALHWIIQVHVILAFVIVMLMPTSRLIHFLVYPLSYLWRPFQKVIWNYDRKKIRNPKTSWDIFKARNN